MSLLPGYHKIEGFVHTSAALRTLRRMLGKATEWGVLQAPTRIKLLKEQGR